jgi:hypothetical protein
MNDEADPSGPPAIPVEALAVESSENATPPTQVEALVPVSLTVVIRDLTRAYPLAMLGLAFVAGAAYAGRGPKRRH